MDDKKTIVIVEDDAALNKALSQMLEEEGFAVASAVDGETWRVTVRDHGIGIDPSQLDRLFQFFSRLQSRARFDGTGMGLALCRRIVEHHGGRIRAESGGEGRGSTFVFELPLNVAEEGTDHA